MQEIMASWDPQFVSTLIRDYLMPGIGTGFVLMIAFYLVGIVVNNLFDVMRGGFFWK